MRLHLNFQTQQCPGRAGEERADSFYLNFKSMALCGVLAHDLTYFSGLGILIRTSKPQSLKLEPLSAMFPSLVQNQHVKTLPQESFQPQTPKPLVPIYPICPYVSLETLICPNIILYIPINPYMVL